MKKIIVSSALSAFLVLPAAAFEVYNADDTKVDLYGSIRGYMGYGETGDGGASAGYLIGVQNNSQFGVKVKSGKFSAKVELGAKETGISGDGTPYREYWGAYDTNIGQILFGKAMSPTIDNAFTSNWLNNDNGYQGVGGVATGNRQIQLQYNVAGLSLALIEVTAGNGRGDLNQESPRIAAAYTIKGANGQPLLKIAGTYKYFNGFNNLTTPSPTGANAWHVWAGLKPTFGNAYISVLAHYGKNGHLYGEQNTTYNGGGYLLNPFDTNIGLNAIRTGGLVEFGTKLSSDLSLAIGAGYQATFNGDGQATGDGGQATTDEKLHGYSAFINLPYKVNANFTFAPQIAYYGLSGSGAASTQHKRTERTGVVAATRFKWDF